MRINCRRIQPLILNAGQRGRCGRNTMLWIRYLRNKIVLIRRLRSYRVCPKHISHARQENTFITKAIRLMEAICLII